MDSIGLYAFSISDPRPVSERIRMAAADYDPSFPPEKALPYKTSSGKPMFSDNRLHLSISHSGSWWLLGLCPQNLGIDLQETRPMRYEALSRRFFHPEETARLASQQYAGFYQVWTAKESYVKWTGTGIDQHFADFSVFSLSVCFQEVPFQSGYVLTVCTQQHLKPLLKYF